MNCITNFVSFVNFKVNHHVAVHLPREFPRLQGFDRCPVLGSESEDCTKLRLWRDQQVGRFPQEIPVGQGKDRIYAANIASLDAGIQDFWDFSSFRGYKLFEIVVVRSRRCDDVESYFWVHFGEEKIWRVDSHSRVMSCHCLIVYQSLIFSLVLGSSSRDR